MHVCNNNKSILESINVRDGEKVEDEENNDKDDDMAEGLCKHSRTYLIRTPIIRKLMYFE